MSINLSDIAILNIKGFDYCCIFRLIYKNEAMHLRQNPDLNLKKWIIKKHVENYEFKKYKNFWIHILKWKKQLWNLVIVKSEKKWPISISNTDTHKMVVYVYFFQKPMHIENTLIMKVSIGLFW